MRSHSAHILLTPDNHLKITDFGTALLLDIAPAPTERAPAHVGLALWSLIVRLRSRSMSVAVGHVRHSVNSTPQ